MGDKLEPAPPVLVVSEAVVTLPLHHSRALLIDKPIGIEYSNATSKSESSYPIAKLNCLLMALVLAGYKKTETAPAVSSPYLSGKIKEM